MTVHEHTKITTLMGDVFQPPGTVPLPLNTVLSNYITSSMFGVVMGYSFQVLDQAIMQHGSSLKLLAHPAAKRTDKEKEQYRLDNNEIDDK